MKLCFFVGPSAGCRIGKNKCPLSALRVVSLQQQYVGYRGAQRTLANRPPSASSAAAQEATDIHGYAEQHLERLAARIIEQ
jgi:hypothetical protein